MEAAVMEMEERVAGYANNPRKASRRLKASTPDARRRAAKLAARQLEDYEHSLRYPKGEWATHLFPEDDEARARRHDRELQFLQHQRDADDREYNRLTRRNNPNPEAAEAMRLYHSGQARSLKEAWAMVKGTSLRRANGRR